MRHRLAVLAVAGVLLVASACTDDDGGTADTSAPDTSGSSDGTAPETSGASDGTTSLPSLDDLPTFDTLQELVDALAAGDITCNLEYEGLEDDDKIVSLCTIESSQATLTIWKDPTSVAELVGSGAATDLTVYGQNWTIDLRDAAVAATVAEALGGETG